MDDGLFPPKVSLHKSQCFTNDQIHMRFVNKADAGNDGAAEGGESANQLGGVMHSMTSVNITFQIASWGPEQKPFVIIRRMQYFVKMSLAVLFFRHVAISNGCQKAVIPLL